MTSPYIEIQAAGFVEPGLQAPGMPHALPAAGIAGHKPAWLLLLEGASAMLLVFLVLLLAGGVLARYAFSAPLVWADEVASMAFLWLAMLGATLAVHRNEHLRLSVFVERLPAQVRGIVQAFALVLMAAVLLALVVPAWSYTHDEWPIRSPALGIPNALRVAAIAFGTIAMLVLVVRHAVRSVRWRVLLLAVAGVGAAAAVCGWLSPNLAALGSVNILLFLVGLTALCLVAGVPIAFCFGASTIAYLAFTSSMPLVVVVGRMDEGMSSLILLSVPIFVLLGCVLDATGMGKAIVGFLASVIGHVKAGMSYVLLGSLFIVSGISGSKVSDMATVAPALFPEMKRRGYRQGEMVALLGTGAAMADTVPPSIVLIVLGAVAGVSISGLFQAGFAVATVLLLMLLVLVRWKARHEVPAAGGMRWGVAGKLALVAGPALVLPFLVRVLVGEGIATATEVSTIAVFYALLIGQVMYGGIGLRRLYGILVETAALTGAILFILGTASAMAWTITQSGVVQQFGAGLATLPGGWIGFMAVTIATFLLLGCLLEGLPAVLLLAPIMFPIARKLGINDIHYSMVVVCAMNVGLMLPPVGVGFYIACRIGDVKPDEVLGAIWPYIAALLVGVLVIAAVPGLSTWVL